MANANDSHVSTKESPALIFDNGRVRIGDMSPSFPPVRDSATNTRDRRNVRIGDMSPAFPAVRTK
jgi:hypothetical protein